MGKAQGLAKLSGSLTTTGTIPSSSIVGGSGGGGGSTPTISAIGYGGDDTATDVAGGRTITLTGTNFAQGAKVLINLTQVSVVTVVSATQITFAAPANAAGSYVLYVVNVDGSTAISVPGIQYSGVPAWTTAAGTLGTLSESTTISTNVAATSNSTVSYSVASGTLPAGASLSTGGVLTGTTPLTASSTTYNFTIRATDAELQDTDRSFSLTINPDVVTWTSANTAELFENVASSITLNATSASGKTISYATDTLPPGMTLTGATVSGTPTTIGTTITVATATAATTLKTANQTITWTVLVGGDIYWKNTMLLLSGNGTNNAQNNTFIDSSANNYTITRAGSPGQGTYSPYKTSWSTSFDGSSGYLSVSAQTALSFGSGNFTVEAWVYPTSVPSIYAPLIEARNTAGAATGIAWACGMRPSGGVLKAEFFTGTQYIGLTTIPLNTWTHIAYTRSSSTLRTFINGVLDTSWPSVTESVNPAATVQYIGRLIDGANTYFPGFISNLRVVKGTAVYTSTFTPSTTSLTAITNTTLLTCQSNRFKDSSTNAFVITLNGVAAVEPFSPFNPTEPYSTATIIGSVRFNGSTDYINIPYAGDPTENFTIEFWWYPLSFDPNYQEIFTKGIGIQIFAAGATMTAAFTSANASPYYLNAAFGTAILNSWNHIAVVKNGTTYTGYINGVGTVFGTSSSVPGTGGNPVSIGYYAPTNQYYTNGYISDARYVTNTAVYTANFTPPTAPLTAITNTQLLCKFANAGIIDGTMQNYIKTGGNAKISTTQSKFGGSSIYFDGTGAYLVSAPLAANVLRNTDFTIEFWLYPSNTSVAYRALVSSENYASTTGGWSLYQNGTALEYWNSPGSTVTLNATSAITVGTWQHVALCRASGTLRLFINGTSVGSVSNSTSLTGQEIWIGANNSSGPNYFYNGYIDDLRITKGYARYTTNFTPPTAALPTK